MWQTGKVRLWHCMSRRRGRHSLGGPRWLLWWIWGYVRARNSPTLDAWGSRYSVYIEGPRENWPRFLAMWQDRQGRPMALYVAPER